MRREYEALAATYDRRWGRYIAETTRRTLRHLEPRPGDRLLDVGCGTGVLLARLEEQLESITSIGCDLSYPMLRLARERLGIGGLLTACDVGDLPFPDARFDLVTSVSSLHYWGDPEQAFREIARVLRPGGILVLTDWSGDHLRSRLMAGWLRIRRRARVRVHRSAAIRRMLDHAGFVVEHVDQYTAGWPWRLITLRARRR